MVVETGCRHFNGYKPCGRHSECDRSHCPHYASRGPQILIIHLAALGAVLRSTSLLPAVQREFPRAEVTWVTKAPADQLLKNIPGIDRVLTTSAEDLLSLSALEFDAAMVIDKSLPAAGVLRHTRAAQVRGFRAHPRGGAVVPANAEALELWHMGLSNQKKFIDNTKTEQRLVHEALGLGTYTRDEYAVALSNAEQALAARRRREWSPHGRPIIGINTGCSAILPAKKLSVEGHRRLIARILADSRLNGCPVVLLGGGSEDHQRNESIARGLAVLASPCAGGLRDGLASVAACDLVFTGDSLGMHMAIALRKWVVAWFGPTCAPEIDLYGRGVKLVTSARCSPCWKKDCQQSVMCYDQLDLTQALGALTQGMTWLTSYSKQLSRETSFSPSL